MKKSVILLIIIVYVASVLMVGLLGVKMNLGEQVKYVTQIEYLPDGELKTETEEKKTYVSGTKREIVYSSRYKVNDTEMYDVVIGDNIVYDEANETFEAVTFEINFRTYPDDAKTKTLKFSFEEDKLYDKDKNPSGSISVEKDSKGDSLTVTFLKNDSVTFKVTPTVQGGGADVSLYVKITTVKKNKTPSVTN